MHYFIDTKGIQPTEQELQQLETRLGIGLSRYHGIISKCDIHFSLVEANVHNSEVKCEITVLMANASQVTIQDISTDLSDAFHNAISRTKRSIERQLKRAKRTHNNYGSRSF
ncbi:MAG: HPF/RaiA family ribosome-associated protein [Glaciecola sp.]